MCMWCVSCTECMPLFTYVSCKEHEVGLVILKEPPNEIFVLAKLVTQSDSDYIDPIG